MHFEVNEQDAMIANNRGGVFGEDVTIKPRMTGETEVSHVHSRKEYVFQKEKELG